MKNNNQPEEMDIKSIWKSYSSGSGFAQLSGNITADVVVIGGGITGITTAQLLKDSGLKVVVLEAFRVGGGSTGGSTGNLYATIEAGFDTLKSKYDVQTIKTIASARKEAIDLIERNVIRYGIDCDFKRVNWYLYSSDKKHANRIEKEFEACKEAGVEIEEVTAQDIPFPMEKGIRAGNQAQFNPLRYVQQLAKAIAGNNCVIYEDSAVTDIKDMDDATKLTTNTGTVTAKYVIHATHTPKGIFLDFHSLLGTYREYGVAVKLASGSYPQGTFWGYYNINDRYSVRSYEHNGQQYLMCIGQPHMVGQKENNTDNINNLEKFLREHFDVAEVTNRWGGQNYKPADSLPYIGRKSKEANEFIATGFSTDGLVWGTVAATVIRDMINNIDTDYTRLFDATRHSPVKAAGKVIKEGVNVAAQFINDYILFKDAKLADIPAGEGKVIEIDNKKVAVYHDTKGQMKACSAICTHLGCVVHFNKAEKTWDCPCHASRFDTDGCILEGPALKSLPIVNIKNEE